MLRVLDLVTQVASSRSTILITGETGTGKELIAKAIHANSPRVDHAFVAGEQRLASDRSARIHAVRAREGRVHQRHPEQEGRLRSRQQRHDLLR